MRARKVYESLDFERGRDPKEVMNIGKIQEIKKWLETFRLDGRSEIIPTDRGYEVVVNGGITFSKFGPNETYPNTPTTFPMDTLKIIGSFYMDRSAFTNLPRVLQVTGNLDLSYYQGEELPEELEVGGNLDIEYTKHNLVMPNTAIVGGYVKTSPSGGKVEMPKHLERRIQESVNFQRGEDPKTAMDLGRFRDKNGIMIRKGDSVFADPESGDTFYEFQGTVDSFHDNYVTVRDMEDDYFDIEPYKLEILDESVSFERGVDPKRSIKIGHAGIYPEKTLFLDIYKYCEENKFPGFPMLTPIHWPENTAGSSLSEPFFKAYVNDGSKDPSLKNVYTVYLTRNEGVVSFHEYQNYLGEWQEQEHPIKYLDYWRRMMGANHIRTIYTGEEEVKESVNFERGGDPHKSLRIGKYSKPIPEIISGDIERMPEPGNQDTYYNESIDHDEVIALFNNWEEYVKDDNYGFWVLEDGGPYDAENDTPDYWLWKDIEGMTVKFRDEYYDIPKTKYKPHK